MSDSQNTTAETPCPPAEAAPPNGTVYFRCCREPNGAQGDFLSAKEANKYRDKPDCSRRALSGMTSKLDAFHRIRVQPRAWKYVMMATLNAEHGHIMLTPSRATSSHVDWWPPAGLDAAGRAALFSLVEDDE